MNIIFGFFSSKLIKSHVTKSANKKNKLAVEDSMLKSQLGANIENILIPNLAAPNLKHYYEASLPEDVQNILAEMFK